MSSGVPIDKAQAVHAGGESALWKWISWNYFFVFTPSRFLTVAVPLIQNHARQQAVSSCFKESCKISLSR